MTSEFLELQESMNNVQKTNGKSTLTVRGSAKVNTETGDFQFAAYQQGEPVQKNVRRMGESSLYETEGKKESSIVAHLKVSRLSEDPAAELEEQLTELTKELRKEPETRPRRLKCLLDLPDAKVWHDRREKKVRVELTIPTVCVDMTATLLNLTSQVTKCFAINRTSLLPRKK